MHSTSYQNTHPPWRTNTPWICSGMKSLVPPGELFETVPVSTQGHHHSTGHAKPALLQPQLTHSPGCSWGWHGWSPGHLNWAKDWKTKERKVVMDCKELVGSETSLLRFITCTGYVETKVETLRVRQNSYTGSNLNYSILNLIKVLETILHMQMRRGFTASRYSRNSSLLTSTILPGAEPEPADISAVLERAGGWPRNSWLTHS